MGRPAGIVFLPVGSKLRKKLGRFLAPGILGLLPARIGRPVAGRLEGCFLAVVMFVAVITFIALKRLAEFIDALVLVLRALLHPLVAPLQAGNARYTGNVDSLAIRRIDQHHAARCRRHAL